MTKPEPITPAQANQLIEEYRTLHEQVRKAHAITTSQEQRDTFIAERRRIYDMFADRIHPGMTYLEMRRMFAGDKEFSPISNVADHLLDSIGRIIFAGPSFFENEPENLEAQPLALNFLETVANDCRVGTRRKAGRYQAHWLDDLQEFLRKQRKKAP